MAQLVVGRDDGAVAGGIELRPSGSAENLENKNGILKNGRITVLSQI